MLKKKILKNDEKIIFDFYQKDDEWIPDTDSKFEKYNDGVRKFVGKKKKVSIKVSQELLDLSKKVTELKQQYGVNVKLPKNDNNIIKLLKISTKDLFVYAYTTSSLSIAIRSALEYYFRGERSALLRPFGDEKNLVNIVVDLIDVFLCEQPKKYMDDVRADYVKKDKVINVYDCYFNLFKQYENGVKSKLYKIYLFSDGKKKFLFYSDQEVNSDNIDEYIDQINIEFDNKKHKFSLLKTFECKFEGQLLIEMDRLINENNMTENSYNDYSFFVDRKFDGTKIVDAKNKVFKTVQRELFLESFEDKTKYSLIDKYIYKITVDGKEFVDMSDGSKTLREIVEKIFLLDEKVPHKYSKLVTTLGATTYDKISIEVIKKKSKKMKFDIEKSLTDYIEKNKTVSDGLNVSDENVVQKSKFVAQIKKNKK